MIYAGLDVHKDQVTFCLLDEAGTVLERGEVPCRREPLTQLAQRLGSDAAVALETTTHSHAVAELLTPHVQRVVVANPMKVRAIAEAKVKTDKVDAQVLAHLLRCDYLPEVWQPDAATQTQRQLTGRRTALVNQRTAIVNRIHSLLTSRLLFPPHGDLLSDTGRAWLAELELSELDRAQVDSELRLIDALDHEIALLDQRIAASAYESEEAKLLMTLPGVGMQVAVSLLAAWGDWRRFKSAGHAASYLGLNPSTRQSAERCHHGPITKAGRSHARMMLTQAVQALARQQHPVGAFFRRIAKRKNRNVAVIATARKLATIAWHVLVSGEPYRYAPPETTAAKLRTLRITVTGQRRRGGVPKGTKARRRDAAGPTRHRPSLNEVYRNEGLPITAVPDDLPAAERRMLADYELTERTQQIHHAARVARRPGG